MKRTYEVRDRADKRAIREFLKREGQFLLPMLELVEQTEVAIDEVIQVMGRATIEAVLEMSAEGVAGVKQAGRSRAEDDTVWYGRQGGVVYLSDRKVRVERPRLRRRGAGEGGEVEVPAYAAMRRPGAVADRMLEVLMAGVSTRKYGRVIGEMADTVGVSKSAVSRETVEASERVLKELMERRLDAWDLLVIYLDGIQMGSHHVLAAIGVDSDGKKHVLGVREGASENAEVTSALLEDSATAVGSPPSACASTLAAPPRSSRRCPDCPYSAARVSTLLRGWHARPPPPSGDARFLSARLHGPPFRLRHSPLPSGLHPYPPAGAPVAWTPGAWPSRDPRSSHSPLRSALRPTKLGPSASCTSSAYYGLC